MSVSIYLNPKGPSHIFYLDKRFEDLTEYVPAEELENLRAENRALRKELDRRDLEDMARRRELKMFHKPFEVQK